MFKKNFLKKFTVAILTAVTMLTTFAPVAAHADSGDYDRCSRGVYWNEPGLTQFKLSPSDIKIGGFYAMHGDVDGKITRMGPFARYYLVHVIDIDDSGSTRHFLIENYSKGGTEWIKLEKEGILDHFPGFGDSIKWLYKVDCVRLPSKSR